MPAARLTQQRYSHGSCTLEVSFQPSALSQWHPRLVAQALTFKLWLEGLAPPEGDAVDAAGAEAETEVETASILIAQGDRATLEAIAQNFGLLLGFCHGVSGTLHDLCWGFVNKA